MNYKLFKRDSIIPIEIGTELTDFRGDVWILTGCMPPHRPGTAGRVNVRHSTEPVGQPAWKDSSFYPGVFDCEFRPTA